jgi:hypothetical protein
MAKSKAKKKQGKAGPDVKLCAAKNKRAGQIGNTGKVVPATCQKTAGWGTDHPGIGRCRLHGGAAPSHSKNAQVVVAKEAVETYGLPREIDPQEALIEELARTAGHVGWLGQKVKELEEPEMYGPVGAETYPRAEPHVWIRLYQEERKHLANVASTCIKAGIEERRVQIAESQGLLLARVIDAVLKELKVPPDKARPILRRHLSAVQVEAEAVEVDP